MDELLVGVSIGTKVMSVFGKLYLANSPISCRSRLEHEAIGIKHRALQFWQVDEKTDDDMETGIEFFT